MITEAEHWQTIFENISVDAADKSEDQNRNFLCVIYSYGGFDT